MSDLMHLTAGLDLVKLEAEILKVAAEHPEWQHPAHVRTAAFNLRTNEASAMDAEYRRFFDYSTRKM